MRLGVGRERAEDGGLVGVHVGERGGRGTAAGGARTAAGGTHAPTVPATGATLRSGTRNPGQRLPAAHRPPGAAAAGRDRRGRGMRGPACCRSSPAAAPRPTPRERFDELVLGIVTRDRRALAGPARAGGVRRRGHAAGARRLGPRHRAAVVAGARHGRTPTRLVLFRRPIEHRCETRADLEAMVLTVRGRAGRGAARHRRRGRRPALRAATTDRSRSGQRRAHGGTRALADHAVVQRDHGGTRAGRAAPSRGPACAAGSTRDDAAASGRSTAAPRSGPHLDPLREQLATAGDAAADHGRGAGRRAPASCSCVRPGRDDRRRGRRRAPAAVAAVRATGRRRTKAEQRGHHRAGGARPGCPTAPSPDRAREHGSSETSAPSWGGTSDSSSPSGAKIAVGGDDPHVDAHLVVAAGWPASACGSRPRAGARAAVSG